MDSLEERAKGKHKAVVIVVDYMQRKRGIFCFVLFCFVLPQNAKFPSLADRGIPWRVTVSLQSDFLRYSGQDTVATQFV